MTKQAKKLDLYEVDIPQKLFYKIGDVGRITKLEPYVLRYWETEFPFLKPSKGKSGQRLYQKKDIEIILEIKRLLYDEKFTIEGVRKKLARNFIAISKNTTTGVPEESLKKSIKMVKERLKKILTQLQQNGA